jgi:hypothetical protein
MGVSKKNRILFWEQNYLEYLREVADEITHYYNYKYNHSALEKKQPLKYLKEKGKLSFYDVNTK